MNSRPVTALRLVVPAMVTIASPLYSQDLPVYPEIPPAVRAYDSLLFSRVPFVTPTPDCLPNDLPVAVDNSAYPWFSGFCNQMPYWTCLQVSSCTYMFAYEMNRKRDLNGKLPENWYPFLYTWTRFNQGINTGVSSFHSFHLLRNQGHMNRLDMGPDSLTAFTGWADGYGKYYRAMHNRIRKVSGIRIDSEEGINLVRTYLYNHLDGSPSGGLVHFTSSSGTIKKLPQGTPEAGKYVYISLGTNPVHGFTTVGYNDSIRYDLNNDGQYTNHLDINGDGKINVVDWEIGGFKQIESYNNAYLDSTFFYLLYSAAARDFSSGGPWNNTVYLVDADTSYQPLLTLKVRMEHNQRNLIRVMAGVNRDPEAEFPDHLIDFPLFNFQGGALPMTGDTSAGDHPLEFGLDVTPLVNWVDPGQPARYFLVVEERDTNHTGYGTIHHFSCIHYGSDVDEWISSQAFVPVEDYGTTLLSVTGTATVNRPVISTAALPPVQPGEPFAVQLTASGGVPPYTWTLLERYRKSAGTLSYEPLTNQPLSLISSTIPYAVVNLPFSFPFFGCLYDTVYVNLYGMIQLTSQTLPYPWLSDEFDMLRNIPAISPAFSCTFTLNSSDGDGIWMQSTDDSVSFRWKVSVKGNELSTNLEFSVTLFPDGRVSACTGPVQVGNSNPVIYSGLAKGDGIQSDITPHLDFRRESGKSIHYFPLSLPAGISLREEGLLTLSETNPSQIFDLQVQVTDARDLSARKSFILSSGLEIHQTLSTPSGYFMFPDEAQLDLVLVNTGAQPLSGLMLALTSGHPGVLLTDSLASLPQLLPGTSVELPGCFGFSLPDPLPDKTACPFTCVATAGAESWEKRFYLDVAAPDVIVHHHNLEDGVNQLLDIGETAYLALSLKNRGTWPASGLTTHLQCNDPFLEILSENPVTGDDLHPTESIALKFLLRASPNTPQNHEAHLTLQLSGTNYTATYPITLRIGSYPVALVTLAEDTTSAQAIASVLDDLQVGYVQYKFLPPCLPLHPHAFLFLGTDANSHFASSEELAQISSYLQQGGTMYMENFRGWHTGSQPLVLKELFRYWHLPVPLYGYDTVDGAAGSFTGDMQFPVDGAPHTATFELVPLPDAFTLFENRDYYPKCIVFAHEGDLYKTIGSIVGFSQLADAGFPSTKTELLERYLGFFEVNRDGPFPFFHADRTLICRSGTVRFTDDSYPDVTSWQWEFPGGSPGTASEQHPMVSYDTPGTYDATLTVSDGIHHFTMHKQKYIQVTVCPGVEPPLEISPVIVYPNPANREIHIRVSVPPAGSVQIRLLDLNGRTMRTGSLERVQYQHETRLSTAGLSPGLYLLQVIHPSNSVTTKVIIE